MSVRGGFRDAVSAQENYHEEVRKPNIGVTSPLASGAEPSAEMEVSRHCEALVRAGAYPVILRNDMNPLRVVADFDLCGIVFSGGGDITASAYGGNEKYVTESLDLRRDAFELPLMQSARDMQLPVLGVCRGMQIANVQFGGTLIEDIPMHLGANYHIMHHQRQEAGKAKDEYSHEVRVTPGTRFAAIVGKERFPVNSLHHQAIRTLAPELCIAATAEDGIIEAVEFSGKASLWFFIGVQWHPEQFRDDDVSRVLYNRFVAESRAYDRRGFQDVQNSAPR